MYQALSEWKSPIVFSFDLKAFCAIWMPGPKKSLLWFPEHLHLLGTYQVSGRNAGIVMRNFEQLDSEEGKNFGDYTLGSQCPPGTWTRAAQAFREQGGLAPGIEYPFVSHALLPHYHEERSVPLSLPQLALWQRVERRHWRFLYSLNDCHVVDTDGAVRRYLNHVATRYWTRCQ